jgi:CheY-like chemotaxis protein/transposase
MDEPTAIPTILTGPSYTLQEAARMLGVDTKTLRLWLGRARLQATRDTVDARRRLLTRDQVDELARIYRHDRAVASKSLTTGAHAGPVSYRVQDHPEQLDELARELTRVAGILERIEARMRQLEAIVQELATKPADRDQQPAMPARLDLPSRSHALPAADAIDTTGSIAGASHEVGTSSATCLPEDHVSAEKSNHGPQRLPTLLIVDDDPDARRMLTETVRLEGYLYETATNGREALDLLRRATGTWVVLLDLLMPLLDGRGFMEELRANPAERARHKIIFISANHNLESHRDTQPDAMLAKPFTITQLLNLLDGIKVAA